MGQSRIKESGYREVALAKSQWCVFCGGATPAVEADHYPPRSLFTEKKWPEGYVFPACQACNLASRDVDRWIALLSRMSAGDELDSELMASESARLMRQVAVKDRDLMRQMSSITTNEKRHRAKRMGLTLAPGELYRDLPFVSVPPALNDKVQYFATKLGKALHFEHTGSIVPNGAEINVRWFTNVNELENTIPEDAFKLAKGTVTLTRGKRDLSDQFNYRYTHSEDGALGIYTTWFRFSFCVIILSCLIRQSGPG